MCVHNTVQYGPWGGVRPLFESIRQDLHVGEFRPDKGQELKYHMFFAVVVSLATATDKVLFYCSSPLLVICLSVTFWALVSVLQEFACCFLSHNS